MQWWRLAEEEPHSRGNLRECVQQQTARGVASDEGVQSRTRSLQATKCFLQCIFLQLGAEIEVVARGTRVPVGRGGRKLVRLSDKGHRRGEEGAVRSILHPIGG